MSLPSGGAGISSKVFKSRGDGNIGYAVYNVQKVRVDQREEYRYVQVNWGMFNYTSLGFLEVVNMMTSSNGNILKNFALLAFCVGKSQVTGDFPARRPVTQSVGVFFANQATSHYLNQWWLDYRRIYASFDLNLLNSKSPEISFVHSIISVIQSYHCRARKKIQNFWTTAK